jgi:hypothetical protein
MHKSSFAATILAAVLLATAAHAETFSTSALAPSPVPPSGVITGSYPAGAAETTFYFAVDLKAGELAIQIGMMGRAGRDKSLEIGLVDPAGKRAGGYYVMTGLDANQELARVLPIDNSGKHVIRITTKGPETTTFRIELGGDALGNAKSGPRGPRQAVLGKLPRSHTGPRRWRHRRQVPDERRRRAHLLLSRRQAEGRTAVEPALLRRAQERAENGGVHRAQRQGPLGRRLLHYWANSTPARKRPKRSRSTRPAPTCCASP